LRRERPSAPVVAGYALGACWLIYPDQATYGRLCPAKAARPAPTRALAFIASGQPLEADRPTGGSRTVGQSAEYSFSHGPVTLLNAFLDTSSAIRLNGAASAAPRCSTLALRCLDRAWPSYLSLCLSAPHTRSGSRRVDPTLESSSRSVDHPCPIILALSRLTSLVFRGKITAGTVTEGSSPRVPSETASKAYLLGSNGADINSRDRARHRSRPSLRMRADQSSDIRAVGWAIIGPKVGSS